MFLLTDPVGRKDGKVLSCLIGTGLLLCLFACWFSNTYTVVIRREGLTGNGTVLFKLETIKARSDSDAYRRAAEVFTTTKKRDTLFGVNGKMMRTVSFKVLNEKQKDISNNLPSGFIRRLDAAYGIHPEKKP